MVRSLWSAASGMIGQQANMDTISNNLSNVNTSGYKKQRADFEDLIYQTVQVAGTPATEDTVVPVPIQMGHGVKLSSTQREFTQGSLQNTENVSDMSRGRLRLPAEHMTSRFRVRSSYIWESGNWTIIVVN